MRISVECDASPPPPVAEWIWLLFIHSCSCRKLFLHLWPACLLTDSGYSIHHSEDLNLPPFPHKSDVLVLNYYNRWHEKRWLTAFKFQSVLHIKQMSCQFRPPPRSPVTRFLNPLSCWEFTLHSTDKRKPCSIYNNSTLQLRNKCQ